MKTNHLLLMAITALLTAGCSQNEIMEVSPDAAPPVGFNVYATAQTRGMVTDNATSGSNTTKSIKDTGFGVIAYYTNGNTWSATTNYKPNFMWNQKVTSSSSVWSYTPQKYWPNTEGDKISFFAYAPYSDQSKTALLDRHGITEPAKASATKPTLTFELQASAKDMVDLVATKNLNVTKQTSNVKFDFKHLLTRVSFKARHDLTVASSETGVYVTAVRLLGTTAQNGVTNNKSNLFYKKATYDWNTGIWTGSTKQDVPYGIDNTVLALSGANAGGYTTQSVKLAYQGSNAAATNLFRSNQYLFLIPPTDNVDATKGGITSANDVRVQIDYDIVTIDANLTPNHSISSTTATVSLPNGTLQRGKAYEFTFTIGLEKVQVTADVTDWNNPATDVAIPSVTATVSTIATAISTLNTTKISNPNCNYFVMNVTSGTVATLSISSALTNATAFKSGDKIELNFAASPGITGVTLPTGNPLTWKADKTSLSAAGKIILTRI